jgi:hypothetical protein
MSNFASCMLCRRANWRRYSPADLYSQAHRRGIGDAAASREEFALARVPGTLS